MYRAQANIRTLRTKRRKNTRVRKFLWRGFFLVSALVFAFFGASLFSFYAPFQLEKVVLIGINASARSTLLNAEAAIARAFAEERTRLFSPTHALLYPRRALLSAVASSSPRVAETSATRGGRLLIIFVSERKPFSKWCAEEENPCLFIDDTGFAFAFAAHDSTPTSTLVFTGGTPIAGTRFLPSAEFALLRETLASAERVGFYVAGVSRREGRDFSFLLSDHTEVRFVLSSKTTAFFFELPTTLSAARLAIADGSVTPPLQYLDLRFADQVVFKRR